LLASGKKTIEIRKWNTNHRGEFLIHSSKNTNEEACSVLRIDKNQLVNGAIIGKGFLYEVKIYVTFDEFARDRDKHFSIEKNSKNLFSTNFKRYGFLVKDASLFINPVQYLGKLGIFEVEL